MYQTIRQCPICQHEKFTNKLVCEDHTVSNESFVIVACQNCDFHFTNPRPLPNEIGRYYESDEYISHSDKTRSIKDLIYKIARGINIRSKLKLISKLTEVKKKRILDIGCGTGHFIKACANAGWESFGMEPIEQNVTNILADNHNISIFRSFEEVLQYPKKFNVITLWHVLEHIENLAQFLEVVGSKLKDNGALIIAVPNRDSYDAKLYKEHWAAWDVPRHLYHFNQKDIHNFCKKNKLRVSATHPLTMDAYYISLLSEQYKTGNKNWIKSIVNGYKSNRYAKLNSKNYSSLIYVIKKIK